MDRACYERGCPCVDTRFDTEYVTVRITEMPWKELTPQEVYDLIREGAADGGWQHFAQRVSAKLKEKNNVG